MPCCALCAGNRTSQWVQIDGVGLACNACAKRAGAGKKPPPPDPEPPDPESPVEALARVSADEAQFERMNPARQREELRKRKRELEDARRCAGEAKARFEARVRDLYDALKAYQAMEAETVQLKAEMDSREEAARKVEEDVRARESVLSDFEALAARYATLARKPARPCS